MSAHPSTVADTLDAGHTPGPWRVEADMRSERVGDMYADDGYSEYLAGWNIYGPGEEIVGCEGIIPGGCSEANARLIAAAPDMLDVLVAAEATGLLEHGGLGEAIRTAIAKARGEVQP